MMAKTMLPIAMLLALVLGVLPASADDRSRDRREPKLEKVAYKLVEATHELHAEAHDTRRHRSWRQQRVVRSLHDLAQHARAFSQRVEHEGVYAHSTQREFRRLERAYETAQLRIEQLHHRGYLHHELARVDRLIGKLGTKLARLDRRHEGSRQHAWHDAGRDRWRASFAWNF
jgi:predicted  nucleic acid-binding Zn-ribbon protein